MVMFALWLPGYGLCFWVTVADVVVPMTRGINNSGRRMFPGDSHDSHVRNTIVSHG